MMRSARKGSFKDDNISTDHCLLMWTLFAIPFFCLLIVNRNLRWRLSPIWSPHRPIVQLEKTVSFQPTWRVYIYEPSLQLDWFVSYLLLFPCFHGGNWCPSNPARFPIAMYSENAIVVERILRPWWNALPLITCAKHPILRDIPSCIKMNIEVSGLGLGDARRKQNAWIRFAKVPDSVTATGVGRERSLAHLIRSGRHIGGFCNIAHRFRLGYNRWW